MVGHGSSTRHQPGSKGGGTWRKKPLKEPWPTATASTLQTRLAAAEPRLCWGRTRTSAFEKTTTPLATATGSGENLAIVNDQDKFSRLENKLIFSDTLVSLRMMHAQFPRNEKVSIQPFILRSQLYSSVKDRTQVDRDLEALKKEKVLRLFKLNTGQDDHAIMFVDDYLKQIDHSVKRLERNDIEIFKWFKKFVIDSKLDVGISHQELFSLLSFGGEVKEKHITLLIGAGLLTRQLIGPNMYWFAIPFIGFILKGLSQGRKELLSFLNRQKYKEMPLSVLEKKRLRLSPLGMRFHLRDLIGSGHFRTVNTPTGLLVRLSKE